MRNHASHVLFLANALLLLPGVASAQLPTAYDYTSIKPPNYKVPRFLEGSLDTLAAAHITLIDLLRIKYDYSPDHIIGLTPEQRNTRFDVVAKIDPPGVTDPEHNPHAYEFLIDALLKNHFHLVVHEEGKSFERLMVISIEKKPRSCPSPEHPSPDDTSNQVPSTCITMDDLAARLSGELNTRVVNETSLPGTFAIAPNWPGYLLSSAIRRNPGHVRQTIQAGLHTDLGLVLVPGMATQNKNLVVDHVEFPAILELTKSASTE